MKRIFVIMLSMIMLLSLLTACGANTSIQEDWAKVVLGDKLPTPQKGKLRSGSNLDNIFMGGIEKVDESYFVEYKNACKELGYTIESKESGNNYNAFNAEAYKLSIYYNNEQISITLSAPEKLDKMEWPSTGVAAKLPAPKSDLGKVMADTSKSYQVVIGDTTQEVYKEYVATCEEYGFNVDHSKQDDRYEAKNAEGYRLTVRYAGCNRMELTIQTPKEEAKPNSTQPSSESSTTEINKDFKAAMDSYEAFMDEYVEFMKKYSENPTDIGLLADYANYMSKYAKFVDDFAKWENEDMSAAETAYYIDVQARVSKKLLEVAN